MTRAINESGLDLIKQFEGLSLEPYQDQGGLWTIGYGHRCTADQAPITTEQAEQLLSDDLLAPEVTIENSVTVPLNDNQYSALVCFAFNIGVGNFSKSMLLTLLNDGRYEYVPMQLARWNRVDGEISAGLSRRRAAEMDLWNRAVETEDA